MKYEELLAINEEHKNNYLKEINAKNIFDKNRYKFRIELYQDKYVIMSKDNAFVSSGENLNGFLKFYKKSDYYYITNLSSIKNKTRLYDIYILSHSENSVLKQVIRYKNFINLCCKKVDSINLVLSKSILKGYTVILQENCYVVLKDKNENLYLYSDSMLRLCPEFSTTTFSKLLVKTLYIDNIDLRNQTSLNRFFGHNHHLESLYLRNLDFSSIVDMTDMFFECVSLKKVEFNNIKGGKNIDTVTFMFYNCKAIEEIDLSCLKVQSVKRMRGMFSNCINLRKIDISTWNLSNLIDMKYILNSCRSLKEFRANGITELYNKGGVVSKDLWKLLTSNNILIEGKKG